MAKSQTKGATRPWEKKHDGSRPWAVDYVRLNKKHAGFRPRWVRREKVELRKLNGWVIANPKDYGIDPIGAVDGQPIGNFVQRNELILMEIPEAMAKERERWMEAQRKAAQRANRADVDKELAEANRQLQEAGAEPATLIDETEGIR